MQGEVPTPQQVGLHRLVIRHGEKGAVIDGFMFFVRHEDKPKANAPHKETTAPHPEKKTPDQGEEGHQASRDENSLFFPILPGFRGGCQAPKWAWSLVG